jgi:hypothetical protein
MDALLSEDAIGTILDPDNNVLATTRLEEAHVDTRKSCAHTKMTNNRASMKEVEDETVWRRRHDDEQKRSARLETLADNEATKMNAEVVVLCKLLESGVKAADDGGAPSNVGRQMTEQSGSGWVRSMSEGPVRRRWERIGSLGQAASNMQDGSGSRVDRALKERRNGLSAEGSAKSGRQKQWARAQAKGAQGVGHGLGAVQANAGEMPRELVKGSPKPWTNKVVWAAALLRGLGMGWSGWKAKHGRARGWEQMQASTNGLVKAEEKAGLAVSSTAAVARENREQGSKATQHLLAGQTGKEATQHLTGATQHLAGQASNVWQGEKREQGSKATQHLAGQTGKEATQHLTGATQH